MSKTTFGYIYQAVIAMFLVVSNDTQPVRCDVMRHASVVRESVVRVCGLQRHITRQTVITYCTFSNSSGTFDDVLRYVL